MNPEPSMNISLTLEKKLIPLFFQLLSKGFIVYVQTGCTVKDLLCEQLGIKDDYLEERIQTIFLDNKTVDDTDSSVIGKDSILSLSAAMPGLLGATLRKGGWYAPMRKQISHDSNMVADTGKKVKLTIKLFNLIVRELGPLFLGHGILVKGRDFIDIVARNENVFMAGCKQAVKDGKDITPEKLMAVEWKGKQVFFQIKS